MRTARDNGHRSGRVAVLIASLAPLSVWFLSEARLQRPTEVACWAIAVALILALAPGRSLRAAAWLGVLSLPFTLAWTGVVAITGSGPSMATALAAITASSGELAASVASAFRSPAFVATSMLTLFTSIVALAATRNVRPERGPAIGLACLAVSLPTSAATLGAEFNSEAFRFMSHETRSSIPWLAAIDSAQIAGRLVLQEGMSGQSLKSVRTVKAAPSSFSAERGLGIFIVGESLRADALMPKGRGRWSAALRQRLRDGLGTRLPDACAGANATALSVPLLVTASAPTDAAESASRPTVLALAKAAGARTAWISNQETLVVEESGHDMIAQISSSGEGAHYDEEAIAVLAEFAAKNRVARSRAVLMHWYGQHFHYKDRYPDRLFADEPPDATPDELQELRYARAAEYGAKVLLDAAAVLDSEPDPAFLVFTSDHGENLPSDRNGRSYHTGKPGLMDSMVPVLVLWNRPFAVSGRASRLQTLSRAHGPLGHRDVAEGWLALMGMPGAVAPTAQPRILSGFGWETIACDALPR